MLFAQATSRVHKPRLGRFYKYSTATSQEEKEEKVSTGRCDEERHGGRGRCEGERQGGGGGVRRLSTEWVTALVML